MRLPISHDPRQTKDDADGISKRQQRQQDRSGCSSSRNTADHAFVAQPRANGTPAHDRLRKKPDASPRHVSATAPIVVALCHSGATVRRRQ